MNETPSEKSAARAGLAKLLALGVVMTAASVVAASDTNAASKTLSLELRRRVETGPGSGRFQTVLEKAQWDASRTAIIVCDMWDLHHSVNATRRLLEMAPRMNRVLQEGRRRGALIIHAPSGCMDAYKDHPARQNALRTPPAKNLPPDIGKWCRLIPAEEQGVYPIDQSDGGEDDEPQEHQRWEAQLEALGRDPGHPWKSQTKWLEIDDQDVISDSGDEIWSVLEDRGIENVILLGVHTNMCVLGRPFGLRQMARNGKNVVLMRDMTDTMYNPKSRPYVSHFTGTDLIIEHIEKWVCPTVTSDQILGGEPFRFQHDRRPHLVIVTAEREYKTEETLPQFALQHLGKMFRVSYVFANEADRNDLPGIEALRDADIALISVRRRVLPKEQMEVIREFVERAGPVVGVRTACHAFSLRNEKPPEGYVAWQEFDHDVIGGHYTGHFGESPAVQVTVAEGAADHPILKGVETKHLQGFGSLYEVRPLARSAQCLLLGSIPGQPPQPVAWVNVSRYGGRVFYTSLADPDDFKQPAINRLLANAIGWAAGSNIPGDAPEERRMRP